MVAKDLHIKPFPEETIAKLELFEKYLRGWLPVGIVNSRIKVANICDYFAGPGEDCNGVKGSPLRITQVVKDFTSLILKYKFRINVIVNEKKKLKFKQLEDRIDSEKKYLNHLSKYFNINVYNNEFKELFFKQKSNLANYFNFIFLDQNGVKEITEDIFLELINLPRTDFMFFVSSSVFKRFAEDKNFMRYFSDMDIEKIRKTNQAEMHRLILEYYRNKIPAKSKVKLYPFTIKKGRNIYGLIFGSNHPLGVGKFLKIAWKRNELNGEANFDIDSDHQTKQMILFGNRRLSKIEKFQTELKNRILSKDKISNIEIYFFTLGCGHIVAHSLEVLKKLKSEGEINFSGHPNISYNKCCKNIQLKYLKL